METGTFVGLLKKNGFEVVRDGTWRTADATAEWIASGRPLYVDPPKDEPRDDPTRVLPSEWLDNGKPTRIITHWTAGGYMVSPLDKEHYHFIVDGDGKLFRGDLPVKANDSTSDGDGYAAHTLGLNSRSIGVAVACMANAQEKPFKGGLYPMKREQWSMMARVVAELCKYYNIPVSPQTVLGHGEVQATLSKPQRGKWDPMVLPWAPDLKPAQVGDEFRALVRRELANLS